MSPTTAPDPPLTGWSWALTMMIGAFALFSLPVAAIMALSSAMLFDAPGAEFNPLNWMLVALLWVSPLVSLATIALAARMLRQFSARGVNLLILVPATWWFAFLVLQTISEVFCEGNTVCS